MAAWARVWANYGLTWLGQTALLLAPGLWLLHLLRGRSASERNWVAHALLVATLLLIGLSLGAQGRVTSLWNVSLPAAKSEGDTKSFSAPISREPSPSPVKSPNEAPIGAPMPAESESASKSLAAPEVESPIEAAPAIAKLSDHLVVAAVTIWLSGALISLVWMAICHVMLAKMRREATPVREPEALQILGQVCDHWKVRAPLLLAHPAAGSPFLTGWWRPAIVLPASGAPLEAEELQAVLGHEATHLKRRDLEWFALGRILCAVLWPQPLLWILCRQLEQIGEESCDEAVLLAGCERQQYARCLLGWAERMAPRGAHRSGQRGAGIGMARGKSSLSRRIRAVLDESKPLSRRVSKRARWTVGGATLLAAFTIPYLISIQDAPQAAPQAGLQVTAPNPRLKVFGDWAVGVGSVRNAQLRDVTLEMRVRGILLTAFQADNLRPAQKRANTWVMDSALLHSNGASGYPPPKRMTGVVLTVPAAVSTYLQALLQNPSPPLESFKSIEQGHVSIGGVERGVLQNVVLSIRRGKNQDFWLARTMRRESSPSKRWVMKDSVLYTFDEAKGTTSEVKSQTVTLHSAMLAPALNEFLQQQTRAASQPATASQWDATRREMTRTLKELAIVQRWGQKQSPAKVEGRVLGDDGLPVAGVQVAVSLENETLQRIVGVKKPGYTAVLFYAAALSKSARDLLGQTATTDQNGAYRFAGLAEAPYQLFMPEYGRVTHFKRDIKPPAQILAAQHRVMAQAGELVAAPDLKVTRGGLVRVRVVDKATGSPLPQVVLLGSAKDNRTATYWVETDEAGQSLFRLPVGAARISVGGQSVPGTSILGALVNGVLYSHVRGGEASVDGARTKFNGSAEVPVLSDKTREVLIRLARQPRPTPKPTPAPAKRLPPPAGKATLIGRVVDEAGRPARGVVVLARMQRAAEWALMRSVGLDFSNLKTPNVEARRAAIDPVRFGRAETGADGSFRLDGLTTAPYNLTIEARDADGVATAVEGAWAREGHVVRRAQPIVLSSGAIIEGRVVDKASGAALGGLIIGSNGPQFPASSDDAQSTRCDAQGRFRLRVAPGTTSLYIQGPWDNNTDLVFADSGKSAESVARIITSRGPYAGSGDVQFEVDGGAPQFGLNFGVDRKERIQIAAQRGQTRRLVLRLRRLK